MSIELKLFLGGIALLCLGGVAADDLLVVEDEDVFPPDLRWVRVLGIVFVLNKLAVQTGVLFDPEISIANGRGQCKFSEYPNLFTVYF